MEGCFSATTRASEQPSARGLNVGSQDNMRVSAMRLSICQCVVLLEMFEDLHVVRISPIKFDGGTTTENLAAMPE